MYNTNVIILLGFHRSGTSFVSSWLEAMGISMGNEKLGANVGNDFGHYEDMDFLRFHESVLKKRKLNCLEIPLNFKLLLNSSELLEFQALINEKKEYQGLWGWKEPRTCLFINEYKDLVIGSNSLVVYRSFLDSVDSLIRRRKISEPKRRNKILAFWNKKRLLSGEGLNRLANKYLESWIVYNERILKYYDSLDYKNNVVFINPVDLTKPEKTKKIFHKICFSFQKDLKFIEPSTLFKKDAFKRYDSSMTIYKFHPHLEKRASQIESRFFQLLS